MFSRTCLAVLLLSALCFQGGFALAEPDGSVQEADRLAREIGEQSVNQAKTLLHRPQDSGKSRTLKDSLKLAYDFNPDLKAARAEVRQVAEEVPQSLALFRPRVIADADVTHTDTDFSGGGDTVVADDDFSGGSNLGKRAGLSVSQPIYGGGSNVAHLRASQDILAAQVSSYKASVQEILTQVAEAHVDVLSANALVELNRQNRERLGKQLEAARLRYEVGEFTRTDVAQAEAREADSQASVLQATAALRTRQAEYRRLTGQEAVGLDFPETVPSVPKSLSDALEAAWKYNPGLQAARFRTASARNNIDVVRGERLPTLSAEAGYDRTYDPAPGRFDREEASVIGLRASVPLYTGGATTSRIRQQKQIASRTEAEEQADIEQVRRDVLAAWEDYQTVRTELSAREKQLAAAGLANESIRQENEVGQRPLIDVLDAEQDFLQAQVDLIGAQRNEIASAYRLAAAIGLLHPKSMGLDPDYADAAKIIDQYRHDVAGLGLGVD